MSRRSRRNKQVDNDGFTPVGPTSKKPKKNSSTFRGSPGKVVHRREFFDFDMVRDDILDSPLYETLNLLLEGVECNLIVCYGIGSVLSSRYAFSQYVLLMLIREKYSEVEVQIYDPEFSQTDITFLESKNISIIDKNESGFRTVDTPTLFYMPHCPMELYSNVIAANVKSNLSNVVIIGNSISQYDIMAVDRDKYSKSIIPTLISVDSLMVERKLGDSKNIHNDCFYNSWLISFNMEFFNDTFNDGNEYFFQM
eukprot:TRINITY_DN7729_c0_g1_i1.p1 TRINITY_DN7729_c0_g1~~TRINITY_DN7729_c0_g1_i1.p1  ORF type:complete len:253 (+),score=34.93 TRINITY_DN7729_c0_g1_i1:105-863(+)